MDITGELDKSSNIGGMKIEARLQKGLRKKWKGRNLIYSTLPRRFITQESNPSR